MSKLSYIKGNHNESIRDAITSVLEAHNNNLINRICIITEEIIDGDRTYLVTAPNLSDESILWMLEMGKAWVVYNEEIE